MIKVFIVILNWNHPEDTLETLKSVARLKTAGCDLKTIVVDNASSDDSLKKLKKYKIIRNKSNLGYAAGNNVGIKYALKEGADYVMVLNNDVIVDRNLLKEFLAVAENDLRIGALTPKIYFAPGFEFHKDRYDKRVLGKVIWSAGGKIDWNNVYGLGRGVDEVDRGKYDNISETDYATGVCLLIRASALKEVGLFDERYFMYYEDTELSQRLRGANYKIVYVPEAILWHKVSQSSGIGSDLNDYFTTRNRLMFGMKYASIRAKFALIRESIKFLFVGRKWQKIGVLDFYSGNLGKGSWK